MSASESTTNAYLAREHRSALMLQEMENKRSAEAQLAKIICPCGLPRDKKHVVCLVCFRALPEHIKHGIRSHIWITRRLAFKLALEFAATRSPSTLIPEPSTTEHRHD